VRGAHLVISWPSRVRQLKTRASRPRQAMPPTTVPPLPRHAVPCERRAAGSMANANARASRRAVLSFGAFVHRKSLLSLHPKRRLRINYGIALCVNKLNVHSVSFARPGECCVRVQPAATTKQTKLKKILVWYHKNFDLRPSSGRRQEPHPAKRRSAPRTCSAFMPSPHRLTRIWRKLQPRPHAASSCLMMTTTGILSSA